MLMDSMTFASGSDWNYDITGSTLSAPADADVVMRFKAARAFKLPTDLVGSQASAEVTPSADATFTILKNNISVGTFQINTSGALVVTSFTEANFVPGDNLEVVATIANGIDEAYFTFRTAAA